MTQVVAKRSSRIVNFLADSIRWIWSMRAMVTPIDGSDLDSVNEWRTFIKDDCHRSQPQRLVESEVGHQPWLTSGFLLLRGRARGSPLRGGVRLWASRAEPGLAVSLALGGDGGIDLAAYPALQAWFGRIRALPGYVGMPGL